MTGDVTGDVTVGPGPAWPAGLAGLRDRLGPVLTAVPMRDLLGARLADWGPGWAVVTATPGEPAGNLAGSVHGAFINALADFAFEVACNSYGRRVVGLELATHWSAAAQPGRPLQATAAERSRSRRTASYEVEVVCEGRVVAWSQAVAYRTEGWHLPEDEVPEEWRRIH